MTWADEEQRDERELIRLAITGRSDEWGRLRAKIYSAIDSIADRVLEASEANPATVEASASVMKDLTTLASDWARAKLERPTLENVKLRAEIASEFAEAKKRYAEAMKAEAEARKTEAETRGQELVAALDNLERLLRLTQHMGHITFQQIGEDGHLLIGPDANQLGTPMGDADSTEKVLPTPDRSDEGEVLDSGSS